MSDLLEAQPSSVNAELLQIASEITVRKLHGVVSPDDCYAWDRFGFDAQRSYMPIPRDARILLVSRYGINGALFSATYHTPEDGTIYTVRAIDAADKDDWAQEVLETVKTYRDELSLIGVQALKIVEEVRPVRGPKPKYNDKYRLGPSNKRSFFS